MGMEDCFSLQLCNDSEEHIYGLTFNPGVIYTGEADCAGPGNSGYNGGNSCVLVVKDESKSSKLYFKAIRLLIN